MKLKRVHATEFQSIRDSNSFEIGDITSLVGKNEAGKSTVLQALYRLNPIIVADGKFDITDDYPRADVEDYRIDVETKKREPATVIRATFELEADEMAPIIAELGAETCPSSEIELSKGYADGPGQFSFSLKTSEAKGLQHLIKNGALHPDVESKLTTVAKAAEARAVLVGEEQTESVTKLIATLQQIEQHGMSRYVYDRHIAALVPRFVYFDEYYQMHGFENIEQLKQRKASNQLKSSDHPMLGLIELARLNLEDMLNPQRTQELVNKLEAAGNYLSKRVLKYWSQNKHLSMRFDVRPARPGDPEGMTSGTNIWAGVYDARHKVTTSLGSRSQGFVWFFSFLAWYSQLQKENKPLILLLDEPGLFLHAKAQMDLLKYFEAELGSEHQLIYTTHSPFMIDPAHWERSRIVQDKGIDSLEPLPPDQEGTKVFSDVLEASNDSLFPLQAALGYEIHQTLFIGPNSLIVEGVSDLLYLQTMTAILEQAGRVGLSEKWTITPVGGAEKVPTFIALIGAQRALNLATLIDIDSKNEQNIENLYRRKLLAKNRVLTYADFTGTKQADAEDMFDVGFYLELINEEYKTALAKPIDETALKSKKPRIVSKLDDYFAANPLKTGAFNHFRPARYLTERATALKPKLSAATLDRFEVAFKRLNGLLPPD
jgi:predicted ATP-dependent endonuclease of OLD family